MTYFNSDIKFKNLINYRRPYEDKPDIDYMYDLFYINNDKMAEKLGWSCVPIFLVDNDQIIGIEDNGINRATEYFQVVKKKFNYDCNEYLNKITKIGKIKIKKIGKYKNDNIGFQYSLHLNFHSFTAPSEINSNTIILYDQTLQEHFNNL